MSSSAATCPLCGRDNQCGRARGAATCWCFTAQVSAEALAAIPAELVGVTCLCPDCAAGRVPSPCTKVCELDTRTQVCKGCARTMAEIEQWLDFSNAERRSVLARIRQARATDPPLS